MVWCGVAGVEIIVTGANYPYLIVLMPSRLCQKAKGAVNASYNPTLISRHLDLGKNIIISVMKKKRKTLQLPGRQRSQVLGSSTYSSSLPSLPFPSPLPTPSLPFLLLFFLHRLSFLSVMSHFLSSSSSSLVCLLIACVYLLLFSLSCFLFFFQVCFHLHFLSPFVVFHLH